VRKVAGVRDEAYWVLTAPLGELPGKEALAKQAKDLKVEDDLHRETFRSSHTIQEAHGDLGRLIEGLLEAVRGKEGILGYRVDGAGAARYALREGERVSALTALGIHGTRSLYVLHYARVGLGRGGAIPYGPRWVRARVARNPVIGEQLEAIHEKLLAEHPALRGVRLEGLSLPPLFVEVERRGQVVFVITARGEVTHVVVGGRAVFALNGPYAEDRLLESAEENLVRVLRERTPLGSLPPRAVSLLLRGKGDLEAVERLWAMTLLAVS
jgi:pimeloyl-ACP methyl ester carboxylesterase